MANKYIVDTHALIWYLEKSSQLGIAAKSVLDDHTSELVLPLIALSEAVYIVNKGKTLIPDAPTLLNRVQSDPRIELYPLNFEVLQESLNALTIPEMHDRLIVSTGLYLQKLGETISILTKDTVIISAALLPIVW
jgi:PIN domain nuclease of toxin-antitoxin system